MNRDFEKNWHGWLERKVVSAYPDGCPVKELEDELGLKQGHLIKKLTDRDMVYEEVKDGALYLFAIPEIVKKRR